MKRLATALALIAFAVYLVFVAPQPVFIAGAALVALICYAEYANLIAAHDIPKPGWFGRGLGVLLMFVPRQSLLVTLLVLACHLASLMRRKNLREVAPEAACNLLGAYYAFGPWRFAIELRSTSVHLLFFALALNWVGDSAAFYCGRFFGRTKLAPIVSPGKSWEGFAASVATAIMFGILYLHFTIPTISVWAVTLMAMCGNIAGQLGDLVESSIKRGAGLKDSGNLLPGHGGALDRLDSSLFTLPVVYALASWFLP